MVVRPADIATVSKIDSDCKRAAAFVPQLSRYSVASVIALAVDVGIYATLCAFAVNTTLAGVAGYAVGMIAHYVMSTAFVFDVSHAQKSQTRRSAEFAASGVLGLMLTALVIAVLSNYFAASAFAAKTAAIVVSFLAVFLARRWFVFAPAANEKVWDPALVYSKSGTCD